MLIRVVNAKYMLKGERCLPYKLKTSQLCNFGMNGGVIDTIYVY